MNIPEKLRIPKNTKTIVAFEGVDGSGKTSLCNKIAERDPRLQFVRIPDAYTQRPFKDYLNGQTTHISGALIYAASLVDRNQMISADDSHCFFITDRSLWSTLALIYARNPNSLQTVIDVFAAIQLYLPIPDVVYVLDIPFEVCRRRIMARNPGDRKYDDMGLEEYCKHMEFYRKLKAAGVNIKFIQAEHMSYDDEIEFVLGELFHE